MVTPGRTVFVAEFTTNHLGNLNLLLRMADEVARIGCSHIKMQKKDVASFYSKEELDAPYVSPYGHTFSAYRSMFEFGSEDYERFDRRCRELGIRWFSTVQDIPSLHFMLDYQLPLYKIASCNSKNIDLLTEVARCVPRESEIVVSLGGATLADVENVLKIVKDHHLHLLHCVSEYPCPPERLRLGNIPVLISNFASDRVSIGYSGHEEGIAASLAAVDLGAEMVERHFCLSRHSFVHHIDCSLEPSEFRNLIEIISFGEALARYYSDLPEAAFASSFGMSTEEQRFLVGRRYSDQFTG